MAFLQRTAPSLITTEPPPPPPPTQTDSQPPPTPSSSSLFSSRSRNQFTLFLAGASFFALSTLVTRRSLLKRHRATIPRFYQPSNLPPPGKVSGATEAFEALNIATINVSSLAMMMGGGLLWAFDISTMEDARRKVRGGLGVDRSGESEGSAEEEFEEWLASVLERKEKRKSEGERRNERGKER